MTGIGEEGFCVTLGFFFFFFLSFFFSTTDLYITQPPLACFCFFCLLYNLAFSSFLHSTGFFFSSFPFLFSQRHDHDHNQQRAGRQGGQASEGKKTKKPTNQWSLGGNGGRSAYLFSYISIYRVFFPLRGYAGCWTSRKEGKERRGGKRKEGRKGYLACLLCLFARSLVRLIVWHRTEPHRMGSCE